MSDLSSAVAQLLVGAVFVVIFWGIGENIKSALGKRESITNEKAQPPKYDPKYRNLVIYYLRPRDLSDTPENSQLRYLVDKSKSIAYLMRSIPEWLISPIKNHEFEWKGQDDESILKSSVKKQFTISYIDVNPEMIGLKYATGTLIADAQYSAFLDKLGKNRLEDLQIARLTRRFLFSSVLRTLLVDFSAKKVWLAPPYWYQLTERSLVYPESYSMHFWQTCSRWSKSKYGFELIPNYYPESQLIDKTKIKQTS